MRLFIGIDPGQTGGIAIINQDHKVESVIPMPLADKELDLEAIRSHLMWVKHEHKDCDMLACIEKVSSMPGQGVVSVFKFGYGTGCIHGVLAGLKIPRHIVTPQAWQKFVLEGLSRGDKGIAISFVNRIYPEISLLPTERSKKPSSGMADAICIARYASFKL